MRLLPTNQTWNTFQAFDTFYFVTAFFCNTNSNTSVGIYLFTSANMDKFTVSGPPEFSSSDWHCLVFQDPEDNWTSNLESNTLQSISTAPTSSFMIGSPAAERQLFHEPFNSPTSTIQDDRFAAVTTSH